MNLQTFAQSTENKPKFTARPSQFAFNFQPLPDSPTLFACIHNSCINLLRGPAPWCHFAEVHEWKAGKVRRAGQTTQCLERSETTEAIQLDSEELRLGPNHSNEKNVLAFLGISLT